MNLLISSLSKKIPLVKCLRQALLKCDGAKLIGADSDSSCIGKYFVDQFWEMPPLEMLTPEEFISYCQYYEVKAIIPTRDGELQYYAKNKDFFYQQGIHVMVSKEEAIMKTLDKLEFYSLINGIGFSAIETTDTVDYLEVERYVVKERYGSGSRSIGLDLSKEEAVRHAKQLSNPIFQPYVKGEEISLDLYVDRGGDVKGVIARTRDFVVGGESQITSTVKLESLEKACAQIAIELGLYGHVMFQVIHEKELDVYLILECNPRFGGASPLSIAMGLDSFYWFLIEAKGESLKEHPFVRSSQEKKLIRYPEDLIL